MPNFEEVPNLEIIDLEGCAKLLHLDPSIGVLRNLFELNLKDCKNLRSIPNNIFNLNYLIDLSLSGCSKAFNDPSTHLKKLESEVDSQSQSMSSSILKRMVLLPFQYLMYPDPTSSSHTYLLSLLPIFYSLKRLDISFCGLSVIPGAIGCLRCLEELNLGGNNLVSLPSLMELSRPIVLNLEHCQWLEYLPELPSPSVIDESYYIFNSPTEFLCGEGGLYIFNCPKLSETRERCSRITFSWMIKLIQASQEYPFFFRTDIVIPGSEIPRWFKNQCEGNSITLDLSAIGHDDDDDNFIGVAYCVVFSVAPHHHYPTQTTNEKTPTIRIGITTCSSTSGSFVGGPIQIILSRDLITDKSDHTCLVYYNRRFVFKWARLPITKEYSMSTEVWKADDLHVEVKKCGYRWLFKEDLQLVHRGIWQLKMGDIVANKL